MTDKAPTERKTVKLLAATWKQIADYRFSHRIATETEAVQRLIDAGLKRVVTRKDRRS